jgi:hypothetical protein
MITDAWDRVPIQAAPATTVAELKQEALARALVRPPEALDAYEVKFRGALVLDEQRTLSELGIGPNSQIIVLPSKKRAAR